MDRGENRFPRLSFNEGQLVLVGDAWLTSPSASWVLSYEGISPATYRSLCDDREDGSVPRLTYDGTTLEMLMPFEEHE